MREFLRKWKKHMVFAAVLSCFINLLQLTFPFYMFSIYRNIVVSYSESSLYTITVAALYALMIFGLFNHLRSRLLATAALDLNSSFRDDLFKGMVKGYAGPQKRTYFQAMDDLETLRNYFSNQGIFALFDAPWCPLYLLLIFFFHPLLGMIATAGAVLMVCLSLLQEFLTRNRMVNANAANAANKRFVDAALRNSEVINSMGMLDGIMSRWRKGNAEVIGNQTIASRYAGLLQSIIKPLQNVLQVLIYGFGAYFVLLGQFDAGLMVASAIIMGRAIAPLMQAISSWRFTLQAREAYKRLDSFMTQWEQQPNKMNLPSPEGRIDVEKATLRLGSSVLLLNISFSMQPGEFLGVIGPSGAGKTSLCRLLLGIWPSMGGKVRLDGVDLFYWDQDAIGASIGYLPQEVELFPGTIADNVARMGQVDEAMVQKALQAAGIDELVQSLPQGLFTRVSGPEAISLSGGQRQRIGLARAMYGDPRLLILDEPNSNLDEAGEAALMQTLAALKKTGSCTCIMVTHKPQLLETMDKMLLLRDGQQAMFGPRQEVMQKLIQPAQQVGKQAARQHVQA
jgi:PrtD family type I secretion system ABC transporter